jgi:hypothetical protein
MPLLFGGVFPVKTEELVQKRKERINDEYEDEGVMFHSEISSDSYESEDIIGDRRHQELSILIYV